MKRILAAALLCACAVGLAANSRADYIASPRWVWSSTKFITTEIPSIRDSVFVCGAAARLDTTVAIPMEEIMAGVPSMPRAGTAVDSTDAILFQVIPTSNSSVTVSADSIYLQTQVSTDGLNWVLVTPNILFQVANTVNPYGTGGIVLEAGLTNSFARIYKHAWATTGQHQTALAGTAPTDNQLWGWNFVRFIVGQDNGGCYRAQLGHWTVRD